MVDAAVWCGARVVAESEDGVSPGPGAEDVGYVWDCEAECVFPFGGGENVAESASCPAWSLGEEGVKFLDGFFNRSIVYVN